MRLGIGVFLVFMFGLWVMLGRCVSLECWKEEMCSLDESGYCDKEFTNPEDVVGY